MSEKPLKEKKLVKAMLQQAFLDEQAASRIEAERDRLRAALERALYLLKYEGYHEDALRSIIDALEAKQ